MTERRAMWIGGAALLATALALRWIHLFTMPFWLDEAYSAYAAGKGIAWIWRYVPYYETHPPFFYSLLAVWEGVFGDSLVSLRASSLIAGLLTLPALAWCGDAIGGLVGREARGRKWLAFVAFGFGCVSIALVEMTREVRTYALMILIYTLAIRALLAILARRRQGRPLAGRAYAGYLVCVALLMWLHNLGPLWAAALGLSLLIVAIDRRTGRTDLGWIVGGHALVILLWLPALRILLDQAPTWVHSTWVRFSFETTWPRLGVIYAVQTIWAIAAVPLLALAIAALWRAPSGRRIVAMLLVLALMPVMLSIGLTLAVAPIFITRTMTPAAIPALLLFAIGATVWTSRTGILAAGAALILGANMIAVDVQNREFEPQRQDWYRVTRWLGARFRPGDQIFAYPNEGALPLARAMKDRNIDWPIRSIPDDIPAMGWGDWHPTGNRGVTSLPRDGLRRIAQEPRTRAVPTIWLLRLGRETYDPGDMFLDELHRGRHVVRWFLDGSISIIGLERNAPPTSPAASDGKDRPSP